MMTMALHLCGIPPQNALRQANYEKSMWQIYIYIKGILLNTWPVLLKLVKVIQNKERLRNCNSLEEPKEI